MAFLRKEHAMFKKLMIQLALVIGLSLTIPMTTCAYTIEADPINFAYFPGSASNELIVLHESGNEIGRASCRERV